MNLWKNPVWPELTWDVKHLAFLLSAGLAHLWLVTLHPFDDGNDRIAGARADMALVRSKKTDQRFYSISPQIRIANKKYYDALEWTQKVELDMTR